jgi:histone acetyltransferase (RNA polymerase elongator complex component)
MAHSNISIFVPHIGCPHSCAFCNQRTITGVQKAPRAEDVKRVCEQALNEVGDRADSEIAFFGGSFTAIERGYMTELLEAAQPFLGEGKFGGIRISTRPDCINAEILSLLKSRGVTAIELGAQSMNDEVLAANERGHTSADVVKASEMIKSFGFELGLQMMVGLYKSTPERERSTARQILEIAPDTVRIYPVAVLRGTALAELYESGEYKLMDFDEVVELCAEMAEQFTAAGIKLLRIGLHASENVESEAVAGFYHPAFGELVRSAEVRNIIKKHICNAPDGSCDCKKLTVYVGKSMVSAAAGHKKSNKLYFSERGTELSVKPDPTLKSHEIRIDKDVYQCI